MKKIWFLVLFVILVGGVFSLGIERVKAGFVWQYGDGSLGLFPGSDASITVSGGWSGGRVVTKWDAPIIPRIPLKVTYPENTTDIYVLSVPAPKDEEFAGMTLAQAKQQYLKPTQAQIQDAVNALKLDPSLDASGPFGVISQQVQDWPTSGTATVNIPVGGAGADANGKAIWWFSVFKTFDSSEVVDWQSDKFLNYSRFINPIAYKSVGVVKIPFSEWNPIYDFVISGLQGIPGRCGVALYYQNGAFMGFLPPSTLYPDPNNDLYKLAFPSQSASSPDFASAPDFVDAKLICETQNSGASYNPATMTPINTYGVNLPVVPDDYQKTITWSEVPNAKSYKVEISEQLNFNEYPIYGGKYNLEFSESGEPRFVYAEGDINLLKREKVNETFFEADIPWPTSPFFAHITALNNQNKEICESWQVFSSYGVKVIPFYKSNKWWYWLSWVKEPSAPPPSDPIPETVPIGVPAGALGAQVGAAGVSPQIQKVMQAKQQTTATGDPKCGAPGFWEIKPVKQILAESAGEVAFVVKEKGKEKVLFEVEEEQFEILKKRYPDLKIVYIIYDISKGATGRFESAETEMTSEKLRNLGWSPGKYEVSAQYLAKGRNPSQESARQKIEISEPELARKQAELLPQPPPGVPLQLEIGRKKLTLGQQIADRAQNISHWIGDIFRLIFPPRGGGL